MKRDLAPLDPQPVADAIDRATDESLLERYRNLRDRNAFEELVRRYERELFSYLRRYLGNTALAEEAFQNTFLQLHLKCGQFDKHARLRPWLYTIATNQAIDLARKNRRHQMVSLDRPTGHDPDAHDSSLSLHLVGTEAAPADEMQRAERKHWIQQAVARLPEHLRNVVMLAYYQGMKYRDVAAALDVPVGTVKSRLHAAIRRLHDAWAKSHPSGDQEFHA